MEQKHLLGILLEVDLFKYLRTDNFLEEFTVRLTVNMPP